MGVIVKQLIFLVSLISIVVEGRILSLNSSDDHLISDGMHESSTPLTVTDMICPSSCSHQFGFMPCAENTAGYIFLIVAYQVLLVVGGQLVNSGSEALFQITGAGNIGGVIFRILMALPSMLLIILSGVFGSKERAQSQVSVGVGINAGTTVFALTIQWGLVMIYGKIDLNKSKEASASITSSPFRGKARILQDTGVKIDKWTCITAGIMLLSLIPYAVLQLVFVFNSSWGNRVITLTALTISSMSLLVFFIYQIFDPKMQERSLMYSLFDLNQDGKITHKEFIQGLKKLIHKHKASASKSSPVKNYKNYLLQLLNLFKCEKENKPEDIDKIMAKILKHCEGQLLKSESLIAENGVPNVERICKIFNELDTSLDKHESQPELKKLITGVRFKSYDLNEDYVLETVISEFDGNKDGSIDEKKFVDGMKKYVDMAIQAARDQSEETDGAGTKVIEEFDRIMWSDKHPKRDFMRSMCQLVSGIAVLTFLGGPLTANILQLSHAIGFPSFVFSFVVVPVAMNGKLAIAAILPAQSKSKKAASLAFSEIYSGVIMNNMVGLTTLLAVVYAKDLRWDFSAEVLTILVVCGTIGTLAYSTKTYRQWTCILAFLLYPFSLGFFYFISAFL